MPEQTTSGEDQAPSPSRASSGIGAVLGEVLSNRGFLACAALLATFAIAFQGLAGYMGFEFNKLPIYLQNPLDQLDTQKLGPYELLGAHQIKPEILDSLGTDMYIQWYLKDTRHQGPPRPQDVVQLFVTYYTDQPDQVPHVPEECYVGGGGYQVLRSRLIDIPIRYRGERISVPFQVIEFQSPSYFGGHPRVVMYTFHTNGQFCATRMCVRQSLADATVPYAYFSKIEVTLGNNEALPERDQAVEAGTRFLQVVLPVLLEEHWPDWEAAIDAYERTQAEAEAAAE